MREFLSKDLGSYLNLKKFRLANLMVVLYWMNCVINNLFRFVF